jgi:O-antigen ligase
MSDLLYLALTGIAAFAIPPLGIALALYAPILRKAGMDPVQAALTGEELSPVVGFSLPLVALAGIVLRIIVSSVVQGNVFYLRVRKPDLVVLAVALLPFLYALPLTDRPALMYAVRFFFMGIVYYFMARIWLSSLAPERYEQGVLSFFRWIVLIGIPVAWTTSFLSEQAVVYGQRIKVWDATPIALGALFMLGIYVCLYNVMRERTTRALPWLLSAAALPILAMAMLRIGTRSVLLGIILAIPFCIYAGMLRRQEDGRSVITKTRLVTALAAVGATLAIAIGLSFSLGADNSLVQRLQQGGASDTSILVRQDLYRTAFERFGDRPLLGAGNQWWGQDGWYPHNLVLELISSYGVIGIGIVLLFFGYLAYLAWVALRSGNPVTIGLIGMFTVAWTVAMISRDISGHRDMYLFFGMLVTLTGTRAMGVKPSTAPSPKEDQTSVAALPEPA